MKTEILATIGPASIDRIEEMEGAGLSGVRINSSHGSPDLHLRVIEKTRRIMPAGYVVYDIKGPKIRLGDLPEPIHIRSGMDLLLRTDIYPAENQQYPATDDPGKGIPVTFHELHKYVKPGHRLYVDDGYIGLEVVEVDGPKLRCKVLYGDLLRSRKGLNHPDTVVGYPYTMEEDIPNLDFAIKNGVDYIADSFTRDAEDVLELRQRLKDTGIRIISKIENPEGVDQFDDILAETDAIMIARGDLGVEMDPWELPELQKTMIEKCNAAVKPVITATQMLESMIDNPRPSRADISDIANAIYDGTDVIMLSGETSIGKFPVECVNVMRKTAENIENTCRYMEKKKRINSLVPPS